MNRKIAFTMAETLVALLIVGVIAATTIPNLVQNYKKHVVETRLQQAYSMLTQVVNRAQADYGDIDTWSKENYVETYILPYLNKMTKVQKTSSSNWSDYSFRLTNDMQMSVSFYNNASLNSEGTSRGFYTKITVDINGNKKPNAQGRDRFNFYIFPEGARVYNTGGGNVAQGIPHAGVFWDGYGTNNSKKVSSYQYRGCGKDVTHTNKNSYCIELIAKNGWKVPKNYPYKF